MFTLDQETGDLIAANALRKALAAAPWRHFLSVEATAEALLASEDVDETVARYVLTHASRFCILPAPQFIAPRWYLEAKRMEGEQMSSQSDTLEPTS